MTYTIIGTGNIAWFLSQRLTAAGHQCEGVYGRNAEAAKAIAEAVTSKPIAAITDIQDGLADICFIAVSDYSIDRMARQLSFKNTVLVHTAGAAGIGILAEAAHDCAVLWPVYSITKNSIPNHREIPCAWEASTEKAKRYITAIAHGITDVLFEAKEEQRKWMHVSAVFGNNFSNHMLAICEQLCKTHDIPFAMLQPIITQTFERAKREHPHDTQTGPAIRRDVQTVGKHVAMLHQEPDWQRVYQAVTASIENMYQPKH